MYLSQTIWVFWFKLFHIMPMPYYWFKNKWKTLILYIKLLVQTILLLVQRDYVKKLWKQWWRDPSFSCGDKLAGHPVLLIFLLQIALGTQIVPGRHQQYQRNWVNFENFDMSLECQWTIAKQKLDLILSVFKKHPLKWNFIRYDKAYITLSTSDSHKIRS